MHQWRIENRLGFECPCDQGDARLCMIEGVVIATLTGLYYRFERVIVNESENDICP